MKIIPETKEDIALIISKEFRSFGGGQMSNTNPIVNALCDQPPSFAAGVNIQEVVTRVLELAGSVLKRESVG